MKKNPGVLGALAACAAVLTVVLSSLAVAIELPIAAVVAMIAGGLLLVAVAGGLIGIAIAPQKKST